MKHYTFQITNEKNLVLKEQVANPEKPDFYNKLFASVGLIEVDIIIQFRLRPQMRDGVREVEHRVSNATGRYEWEEKVNVVELYEGLTPTQKQMLFLLAEYSAEEICELTGLKKSYIRTLRTRIYERIDMEGTQSNHNPKFLKEFCKALTAAGVELIVWNPEMQ
jgi:DNA-binding CsgD family transcriptional regulator